MSKKTICCQGLLFELPQVFVDCQAVLTINIYVLSVIIISQFTIKMQTWMILIAYLKRVLANLAERIDGAGTIVSCIRGVQALVKHILLLL